MYVPVSVPGSPSESEYSVPPTFAPVSDDICSNNLGFTHICSNNLGFTLVSINTLFNPFSFMKSISFLTSSV